MTKLILVKSLTLILNLSPLTSIYCVHFVDPSYKDRFVPGRPASLRELNYSQKSQIHDRNRSGGNFLKRHCGIELYSLRIGVH
jgi:hypothetical protein